LAVEEYGGNQFVLFASISEFVRIVTVWPVLPAAA
jgi:hypothetical protein